MTIKPITRVTEAQLKRYEELIEQGVALINATPLVQREFNLPYQHTRQAVTKKLREKGVKLQRGRRKKSNGSKLEQALELTEDQAVELLIGAFNAFRLLPTLKQELEKEKAWRVAAQEQLQLLEASDKKKEDQARRFRLAQQQGVIPNLTEHL